MLSPIWGPFDGPVDAANSLGGFTDQVLDPQFGIAWIGGGTLYTIRPPTYDAAGDAELVVFEFRPMPPAPPKPAGIGARILAWLTDALRMQGEAELANSRANLAASQAIAKGVTTLYQRAMGSRDRQLDTAGVVLDGVAIGFSLVLMSFGPLEVLGMIALVGGVAMLLTDGAAYVTELAGYDETADDIKSITFYPRCVFTLMALPDAAWGVGKAVLESAELGSKAIRAGVATDRAAQGLARTTRAASAAADPLLASEKAAMAARYAKVGESAQRRAQAARLQLAKFMGSQAGGRLVIPPGLLLLLKEKDDGTEARARMAEKLKQFTFHVTAVHKS